MSDIISSFMSQRIAVASALREGKCGGSIHDAILILSGAISAIASEVWPGDAIDRRRITEVLVRYASNSPHPAMVSVPILCQGLDHDPVVRLTLESEFLDYDEAQILIDVDVDKSEADLHHSAPEISLKTLRQYSYANLFYTELRSGIVHQYQTSSKAELEPMTRRKSAVSYANVNSSRRIVFHFAWLVETFRSVAENLDLVLESLPLSRPSKWWIDG